MIYKTSKVKIRSPERNFFDIVAGVLQEDTLAPYLFVICREYVLRTSIDPMKKNGFIFKKDKQTMLRTNYYGLRLRMT